MKSFPDFSKRERLAMPEPRFRLPSIDERDSQDAHTGQQSTSLPQDATRRPSKAPDFLSPEFLSPEAKECLWRDAHEAEEASDKPTLRRRSRSRLQDEADLPPVLATPSQLEALTDSQLEWSCLRIDDDESSAPWLYTGSFPGRLGRLAIVAVAVLSVAAVTLLCELTHAWAPSTQRHTVRWRDQVNAHAARWMVLPPPAAKAPSHL